jgi:nucleoside phosphorylase/predicted phosphodiesterase
MGIASEDRERAEALAKRVTVGIVTALPKEHVAVKAMLDGPVDHDDYVLGEMPAKGDGTHVVALLRTGMGNTLSAAKTAKLLATLDTIDAILMVGIAGGVPNTASPWDHVRLGDIVVSDQRGVIDYGHVSETRRDGKLVTEHRNPPRPPSSRLLDAVDDLVGGEHEGKRPWLDLIRLGDHLKNSARPGPETDVLLGGELHPADDERRPGEPRIFHGPIASSSVLLKDPQKRDELLTRFGVRAVEMEGAGIADAAWDGEVGYLVVRGICDYCDEIKGYLWQGYAAIIAASYARAVLGRMRSRNPGPPVREIESGRPKSASRPPHNLAVENLNFRGRGAELASFDETLRNDTRTMTSLTWLHLSDWHQHGADFDRTVVLDALLQDIRYRSAIDPRLAEVDCVVFSGDLANGGKAAEYKAAREQFLDPVLKAVGVAPARLMIVPGNHDLDRDELKFVPAGLTKLLSSSQEVNEWLIKDKPRTLALDPFSQFKTFVAEYTGQRSPDYANVLRFEAGGRSVAILGLNSAWMCGRKDDYGNVDDKGHLVVGEPQIHAALEAMRDDDIRIAVLHHPWEWLADWDRDLVQERVQRASHFVLMGHVHRAKVNVSTGTGGNCVEIPAGASYDRRMASNTRYTNAYNWIHLDFERGQGTALLRRWSEEQCAWMAATDTCDGGRHDFQLPKDLCEARLPAATPSAPIARFDAEAKRRVQAETHYRKLLLETCDIVNLANLPEQDRHIAHRQLELRRLYVPLRVRIENAFRKEDDVGFLDGLEKRRIAQRQGHSAGDPRDEQQRIPVGERLTVGSRLIVLGDPGAGKTTLIRWIATAYLLRFTKDPGWREVPDVGTLPDQDWLPIVIRCRELDLKCLTGTLDDILGHTLRKSELSPVDAETLKTVLRERMQEGKALLLLDGLDEINEPVARARFCAQLDQIAIAHPDSPILVTSRIVGYREMGYRLERGFEHLTLTDLEHDEKDDFARRWCALTELPERRDDAAADMIHDIHSSDRIERLTGNLMLLTTFALVKRKVGKLPSRRADLYYEAVQVMLHWRREVDEPLDPYEAIPQLEYLAYAMCDRVVQRLRREEVLALLRQMRTEYPNIHAVKVRTPEEFLRLVESRTALLMESGRVKHLGTEEPVYEFRHLTFQEYLAARALVDGRFPGCVPNKSLAENVAQLAGRTEKQRRYKSRISSVGVVEAWREALRLCVAICHDNDVDRVISAIVRPGIAESADTARARAILGALCLADEPNASAETVNFALETFIKFIGENDSGAVTPSNIADAITDLATTRWVPMLRSALVKALYQQPSASHLSIGSLIGTIVGGSVLRDLDSFKSWLTEQTTQLQQADEPKAIEAALGVMHLTLKGFDTRTSDIAESLLSRLSGSTPMMRAASWALGWLNDPKSKGVSWSPTTSQAQLLITAVSNRAASEDGVRYLCWIFKNEKMIEAIDPLIFWLNQGQATLRIEVAKTLGALQSETAIQSLITLLVDPEEEVRTAAADALIEFGDESTIKPVMKSLESSDPGVRRTALRALVKRGPVQDMFLLSLDLDGFNPFIDPRDSITNDTVARAAAKLNLPREEIRSRYEALSAKYTLTLAWRPSSP